MPLCRSLLALALAVSISSAAELQTLKGEIHKGDLVSVTDKEVVFAKATEQITVPIAQILHVTALGPAEKIPPETVYHDVELNDGTLLHCSHFLIKGKNIEATLLLTGQKLVLPLASVGSVLANANLEKYRKDWTDRLKKKGNRDILARLNDGVVNPLPGLIGFGSADGKTLDFTLKVGTEERELAVPLENIHGLIFKRDVDPNIKLPICKLVDTYRNIVQVLSVVQTPEGLTVTTPSGAKLEYPLAKVTMLDYSNGKLVFLSDLEPDRLVELSTEDRIDHYKRDRNMDGKERIKLKTIPYPKGLAIHADTQMDFILNGEFSVFKAVIGFDDAVGGVPGPVKVRIEADGKELFSKTFDRKDWKTSTPAEVIEKSIKDVQTLRIEVMSGDLLTLGKHVVIADAKVSK